MTNEPVAPPVPSSSRFMSDRGYAAVLVALVLVPLMGFAGLAVDIGAWYSRASSLQRAADAASLAGVVWQPDFATAEANARQEAARNGFVHGVDGISVNIVDTGLNELEVEIVDNDADMFFASLFLDNVTISRRSVAEYTKSIPMGNPDSYLGTDPERGISEENYLSISGANTDKKGGDRHASKRCDGSTALCTNGAFGNLAVNGGEFDENGYTYSVSVNTVYASPLVIQVYDPGFYEAEQSCNPGGGSNMPPGYDFNDLLTGGLAAMFPGDGADRSGCGSPTGPSATRTRRAPSTARATRHRTAPAASPASTSGNRTTRRSTSTTTRSSRPEPVRRSSSGPTTSRSTRCSSRSGPATRTPTRSPPNSAGGSRSARSRPLRWCRVTTSSRCAPTPRPARRPSTTPATTGVDETTSRCGPATTPVARRPTAPVSSSSPPAPWRSTSTCPAPPR